MRSLVTSEERLAFFYTVEGNFAGSLFHAFLTIELAPWQYKLE